ncbi:coiled-coil domain-containing protein 22 isoform X2 [Monodelphis domestica]|uniref:coiled-coil domain-containing protein 22 isoform X2 n=1 Tax=Monodelphis domestica TaxID=13616 RepID=UPI0024E1DB99|nr:coiled-coil domain-containing protein 22 isoform X2 [Monodelphis domestica]
MEEADRILIHSLRQAGSAIPEDVQSLRAFTAELAVTAVVGCLQVLCPSLSSSLSPHLPPGMSARFRLGMSLAQACSDLGYPRELGYQSFLYPSEPDLRQLLLFLAERLPPDPAQESAQPSGGESAILLRAVGGRVRELLAEPWVPPALRPPEPQDSVPRKPLHIQAFILPEVNSEEGASEVQEFQGGPLVPPVPAQIPCQAVRAASFLEEHLAQLCDLPEGESSSDADKVSTFPPSPQARRRHLAPRLVEQLRQGWGQTTSGASWILGPGAELSELLSAWGPGPREPRGKGSRFTHAEKFTFAQEQQVAQALLLPPTELPSQLSPSHLEQETWAGQEAELASLQDRLELVGHSIKEAGATVKRLTLSTSQVEAEAQQDWLSTMERDQTRQLKRRAVDLLPDAPGNLAKLQVVVEASAQRVIHLAGQWERHRVPLMAEYRVLKMRRDQRELESSHKAAELQALQDCVRLAVVEARRKEGLYKQLVAELETLPRDMARSAYTHRILEIVGSIRKQKEEITKILSDTKLLQKEINALSGKLDRTFAVADELVFKDAKKDDSVRKAYKYLAALHENCSQLIQTIEDTGTILREVRDLEEQIETETSKKTLSNLEKILEDYKAVRQENAGLLGRLHEA